MGVDLTVPAARDAQRGFGRSGWWAVAVLTVVYLLLASHVPMAILGNASYDDALFMHHALNLLHGQWLGPYNDLTLAKGPGYSVFLAVAYALGLPVSLSQPLFYAIACLCVALALQRLVRRRWFCVVVFAVLLWHPGAYPLRAIRDSIYGSETLLVCAALLALATVRGRAVVWLAAGGGLAFGGFWLTREEGMWLLPGLVLFLVGLVWVRRKSRPALKSLAVAVVCFVVAFAAVDVGFKVVNLEVYGRYVGVDFTAPAFKNAIAALQSVRVGKVEPHVPVPQEVRHAIYAVSPAFAQLSWYLENKASPGYSWRTLGCRVYRNTCGDFAGGWFAWALRAAVASKGYYRSPNAAARYYERLTDQIHKACVAGKLNCQRALLLLMPQMAPAQWRELPGKVWEAIEALVFARARPSERGRASVMPAPDAHSFLTLLGHPVHTPMTGGRGPALRMRGWYHASGSQWFYVRCANGTPAPVRIQRRPSPDIVKAFHDPQATWQRFTMWVGHATCPLQVVGAGVHAFDLHRVLQGQQAFQLGPATLYVDHWQPLAAQSYGVMTRVAEKVRSGRIDVYRVALPILALLGVVGWLLCMALLLARRARIGLVFVAASVLWCMVACHVAVVVLVDASAFPAINAQYLTPAYPLACLAALLSMYAAYDLVRTWRRGKSPRTGAH